MSATQLRFEPEPGHDSIVRLTIEQAFNFDTVPDADPHDLFDGRDLRLRLYYPQQGQIVGMPTRSVEYAGLLAQAAEPLNELLRKLGGER